MKTALLIICLLEFNVITLLARGLYVKNRSRNMWRNRHKRLSDEYLNVIQNNSDLRKKLRKIEKNYVVTEKISAYELLIYDFTQNAPLGKYMRIRRDDK